LGVEFAHVKRSKERICVNSCLYNDQSDEAEGTRLLHGQNKRCYIDQARQRPSSDSVDYKAMQELVSRRAASGWIAVRGRITVEGERFDVTLSTTIDSSASSTQVSQLRMCLRL